MTYKPRILLVDSDSTYTEAVGIVLEAGGYEVFSALTGVEGLRKIGTEKPDVVVLDLILENTDEGFTVARKIRNSLKSDVPVIMLSSLTETTGYSFSYKEHPDYFPVELFLEKPVSLDTLIRSISDVLRKGDV